MKRFLILFLATSPVTFGAYAVVKYFDIGSGMGFVIGLAVCCITWNILRLVDAIIELAR
ncbi:hypothetical protein [Aureimonas pseudogalii]|uniref:Uncharacterized protein n=1 Tax=Aureimonas pseudogalii TaxID=1744844 RepID=A0A7W6H4L2_9HYPH|nr:hypothetical protein [Aureimonas pseudogalii]MBB3997234.1 hypothetical protein [Aureimonas pseudogalii]